MPKHYKLRCQVCGTRFDDDGFILECPTNHDAGLLTTEYSARFEPDKLTEGIFRYRSWLPVRHDLPSAGKTATYQSE